jgi:hypothetical protein
MSSWSLDRREESVETTLRSLRKAVFAGGDFRTAKSKGGLVLVTRGKWPFSDAWVLDLVDRVAQFHTAVWRDRGARGHKIFLVPAARSWAEEGRTKALIMEGNPDTYDPRYFTRLLSHELFHEWNPRRLNYPDDEELYWFTEGFTDYFTVATLWRSGIWNFDQVIQDFNEKARSYYASTTRNLTAKEMVELRQSNFSANRLPYQQGYLLAARWNLGGQRLDLGMRNLLKDNREPLSNSRIVKALSAIGIESAEEEVQRFVVEGKTIELRANLWDSCATETKSEIHAFDMGFDWTNRIRQTSSMARSRIAMLGVRVFATARSGHPLMWLRVTRLTWPKLRSRTDKGPVASSTIQPRRRSWWFHNTRPLLRSATPGTHLETDREMTP